MDSKFGQLYQTDEEMLENLATVAREEIMNQFSEINSHAQFLIAHSYTHAIYTNNRLTMYTCITSMCMYFTI